MKNTQQMRVSNVELVLVGTVESARYSSFLGPSLAHSWDRCVCFHRAETFINRNVSSIMMTSHLSL